MILYDYVHIMLYTLITNLVQLDQRNQIGNTSHISNARFATQTCLKSDMCRFNSLLFIYE